MIVVAHRTCPRDAPENSLPGIAAAAARGADFVELDVRRTLDGVPVLLHDPLLLRTTGWPAPVRLVPSAWVTHARLLGGHGEKVPTLASGLAALPPSLGAAIDVKDAGAMAAVLRTVGAAGCLDRVLLWSQHPEAVRTARAQAPGVEVALLRDTGDDAATHAYCREAAALGAHAVSVHQDVLTRATVGEAHAMGLRVYCWVQELERIGAATGSGLDGIVTDWPAEARAAVDG